MRSLMFRTVAGFLFLMIVLALALFLSAGSLAYWQAYLYLADFAICTILITAYLARNDRELLEGRVQAGPVAETQRSPADHPGAGEPVLHRPVHHARY